jgi:hypothetical protein
VATKQATKKAKTVDSSKTANTEDAVTSLELVKKAFEASWTYTQGSWHDRWQSNYKLYNNERVNRGYNGITDTFVPMTFSTVETLTSGLFGSKPKFDYMPPSNKKDQDCDILNGLLDYYWDKDIWSMKVINTGRSMVMLGVGVDYFCWDVDHPVMINVPLRDFFIDPNASSLETAGFMGRRYLTTIDELKSYEVIDPETGKMTPKYQNLDKLKQVTTDSTTTKGNGQQSQETTDKQEKDLFYGSTLDNPVDNQVECIEYWTEDKVITIANRKVVIEDAENYYKAKAKANKVEYPKGILPFACSRNYVDGSLFYAKSDVDFISQQQELLNDITNQNTDAITYNLNQMYTLDPKYAHLLEEIENLPGAVYPVEAGALNPISHGVIPPEAFNERMNIKADIRETTASNEVVKGAASSPNGQTSPTTATEINAQIAGAGQRIGLKVTQIENEYFHQVAKIVFAMVQLYVTEKTMVRILGKDGIQWKEFDPKEFKDQYEPRVQLDITIQNKKAEQAATAKDMLAAFLNDPDINQQELKKLVLRCSFDLDPDEVQLLMTPEPQPALPPTPDPMAGGMMPGMPGAMPPMAMPPQGAVPPMPPQLPPEAMPQAPPPELPPGVIIGPDGMPIDLTQLAGVSQ